jgi:hypothetical protein
MSELWGKADQLCPFHKGFTLTQVGTQALHFAVMQTLLDLGSDAVMFKRAWSWKRQLF